jgi:hypothetical protein
METMLTPIYADVMANVGRTVLNILAIFGGFLIGNMLVLVLSRAITKLALTKPPPVLVEKLARLLGGIVVAILVGMLVFGDGDWGFGGSGKGGTPGKNDGETEKSRDSGRAAPETKPQDKKDPTTPKKDPTIKEIAVKIDVLGGDARESKFYFLEDERSPISLDELKAKVRTRPDGKKVTKLIIHVYKNSAALDSGVVSDLKTFASNDQLATEFPAVQDQARPER